MTDEPPDRGTSMPTYIKGPFSREQPERPGWKLPGHVPSAPELEARLNAALEELEALKRRVAELESKLEDEYYAALEAGEIASMRGEDD